MNKIIESSVLFAGSLATILVLLFPPRLGVLFDGLKNIKSYVPLQLLKQMAGGQKITYTIPDYTFMAIISGVIIGATLLAWLGVKVLIKAKN
jgi:hypothetical protein